MEAVRGDVNEMDRALISQTESDSGDEEEEEEEEGEEEGGYRSAIVQRSF